VSGDIRRLGRIRALALAIGVLALVVVAVSAYLRLDAAGLGCADWPACYGAVLGGHPPPLHYGFARVVHRIAASTALVLTCVLVWQCRRPQPLAAARPAQLLLLLMLVLAALGFFSADPRRVLVGFLNIVGGLGLVSFSWRVVLATRPAGEPAGDNRRSPAFRIGIAALSLTVLAGAWLGASYSAVACNELPGCAGAGQALLSGWSILNPGLLQNAAPAPGDAGGVLMHLLHRGFALLSLFALGGAVLAGWRNMPAKRKRGWGLLLLLPGTMALGALAVAGSLPLWVVVGHGVAAALLLAATATLMRR